MAPKGRTLGGCPVRRPRTVGLPVHFDRPPFCDGFPRQQRRGDDDAKQVVISIRSFHFGSGLSAGFRHAAGSQVPGRIDSLSQCDWPRSDVGRRGGIFELCIRRGRMAAGSERPAPCDALSFYSWRALAAPVLLPQRPGRRCGERSGEHRGVPNHRRAVVLPVTQEIQSHPPITRARRNDGPVEREHWKWKTCENNCSIAAARV